MVTMREARQTSTRPLALRETGSWPTHRGRPACAGPDVLSLTLAANDGARMAQAEFVSGNFFATPHVTPFLGRFFDTSDDGVGAAAAAVLSHRLWEVRFGAE